MKTMDEKVVKYASLIQEISMTKNDERAAKCGFDLLMGVAQGCAEDRYEAWVDWLKAINGGSYPQTERNGVWVPGIPLKFKPGILGRLLPGRI